MNKETLRQIAKEVRTWVEDHRATTDAQCAVCSCRIFQKLREARGHPIFCLHEGSFNTHCFVVCDGYLIDVTADQFGTSYPKVIVRKHINKAPWMIKKEARTFKEIRELVGDWPLEQRPRIPRREK